MLKFLHQISNNLSPLLSFLPTTYGSKRESNVFRGVCPSVHKKGGRECLPPVQVLSWGRGGYLLSRSCPSRSCPGSVFGVGWIPPVQREGWWVLKASDPTPLLHLVSGGENRERGWALQWNDPTIPSSARSDAGTERGRRGVEEGVLWPSDPTPPHSPPQSILPL